MEDKVKFCGFLDNTQTFYHACDLITMFSIEEPLGLIPLEAAVNYTPTIANAVGGLPETIQDGKTGWLVNIHDANKVQKVLSIAIPATYCEQLKGIYSDSY